MLGFSLASVRFGTESYAWVEPSADSIDHGATSWYGNTARTTSSKVETKSARHQNWQELFDYVYDLVDATVGVELWRDANVTGEILRKRFREAVITTLGVENCACPKLGGR